MSRLFSRRDNSQKEENPTTTVSLIPGVPMLTLNPTTNESNIATVQARLHIHVARSYDTLGNCIKTIKLEELSSLDETAYDLTRETDKFIWQQDVKALMDQDRRRRNHTMALYGDVLSILSPTSLERTTASEKFDTIETERDGFALWKLVYSVHTSGISGEDESIQYHRVTASFINCKQRRSEDIIDYFYRFEQAVQAYEAIGQQKPAEKTQAVTFVKNLDYTRYCEFQRTTENASISKVAPYPTTLREAYRRVVAYIPISMPTGQHQAQSVFKTKKSHQNGRGESQSVARIVNSDTKSACEHCGRDNHLSANCFSLHPCDHCGKKGHRSSSCWTLKKKVKYCLPGCLQNKDANQIILDSGAQISIFSNQSLLTNIRSCEPFQITGIVPANDGLTCTQIGTFMDSCDVYISEFVESNILSFASMSGSIPIHWDQTNSSFILDFGDAYMLFQLEDNLFIHTVQRACVLNLKALENAKAAQDLQRRLGFISKGDLMKCVLNGSFLNNPVTPKDISTAEAMLGKCEAEIKGKTTKRKPNFFKEITVDPVLSRHITLECDIAFGDKEPYLFSVSQSLDLTLIDYIHSNNIESKSGVRDLRNALMSQISKYKAHGFHVNRIVCDHDSSLIAMTTELNSLGIIVAPCAPGSHGIPHVDRRIRTIKERVRSILASLPYKLPKQLLRWCFYFAVSRFNISHMVPGTSLSAKECFTGVKTDFKRDLRVGFGDYVQAHLPETDNTLSERTTSCISLLPTGSATGAVKFYSLSTGRVITRDRWTCLPIPDTAIEAINSKSLVQPPLEIFDADDYGSVLADENEGNEPFVDNSHVFVERIPLPPSMDNYLDDPEVFAPDSAPSPIIDELPSVSVQSPEEVNFAEVSTASSIADPPPRYNLRPDPSRKVFKVNVRKAVDARADDADKAIASEVAQMIDKGVWAPTSERDISGRKIIPSSMILKDKFDSSGRYVKMKARLVAGGHRQVRGGRSNSSPTLSTSSLMMLASIAAQEGRTVATADIGGAYLHADIDEDIFMTLDKDVSAIIQAQHPSYVSCGKKNGKVVVKLRKALYGCLQSGKLWYNLISSTLLSYGFQKNPHDKCVFNCTRGSHQVTIGLYVDDLFITSKSRQNVDWVLDSLKETFKDVSVHHGVLQSYLGMTFDFAKSSQVFVSMEGYTLDLLKSFDLDGKVYSSPSDDNLFNINNKLPLLNQEKQALMHSTTAKVLYLATKTRPDIILSINFLCTRVNKFNAEDEAKLDRILSYLSGTICQGVTLGIEHSPQGCPIQIYADASFAVHPDARSHSGLMISLGRGGIVYKSKKQPLVTKSSTEAELVSANDSISFAYHIRDFLLGQGMQVQRPALYQDNTSTIRLIECEDAGSMRTKHINARYFFVREQLADGHITVEHMPTGSMTADVLTKPLQGKPFRKMRDRLLGEVGRLE